MIYAIILFIIIIFYLVLAKQLIYLQCFLGGNMKILRKRFAINIFMGFFLLNILFFACSNKKFIKIGFVAGITGRVSELGISERAGATLAVNEINEAGGINGRLIELIVKDDQNDAERALEVDKELIDEGVVAIIGHATSTMTKAVVPLINKKNILLISPTASTTDLSGIDDFLVRITPLSDAEMKALAKLANNLNIQKIAVIYDLSNMSLVENNLKFFRKYYKKNPNNKIISETSFTSKTEFEFFPIVKKAIDYNPDGIFILVSSVDTAQVCQQIRKIDKKLPIFSIGWAS